MRSQDLKPGMVLRHRDGEINMYIGVSNHNGVDLEQDWVFVGQSGWWNPIDFGPAGFCSDPVHVPLRDFRNGALFVEQGVRGMRTESVEPYTVADHHQRKEFFRIFPSLERLAYKQVKRWV